MIYPILVTHLGPDDSIHRTETKSFTNVPGKNSCYYFTFSDLEELNDENLKEMQGKTRKAILLRLKQIQKLERQLRLIGNQLHQISDLIPDDTLDILTESETEEEEKLQSGKGKEPMP